MVETGTIDKAIFSISIGMEEVQSKMTFGGYDNLTFATGDIEWHDIYKTWYAPPLHWAVPMNGVSFKSPNGDKHTWGQGRNAIVDSGTSFVLMPKNDLNQIIYQIEQDTDMTCDLTKIVPICSCS
jgi:hypothetical protein